MISEDHIGLFSPGHGFQNIEFWHVQASKFHEIFFFNVIRTLTSFNAQSSALKLNFEQEILTICQDIVVVSPFDIQNQLD